MNRPYRLAILQSHPIQYFAPLLRRLAQEPALDVTAYFCSRQGAEEYVDREFGRAILWDVPLLEGYTHHFLPNQSRQTPIGGFWSLINPAIVGELWRGRYDALWVHGHNYFTILLAMAAAKVLGIPVLMRCETHMMLQRATWKQAVRRPLMRAFFRHACRAFLFIGTRNRQYYAAHGVPRRRLFFVPYAVDNAFFRRQAERGREEVGAQVLAEAGWPVGKTVILYASKLTSRKRPLDLLRAFAQARSKYLDAALVFVGSGEQQEELKQFACEHAVPDVYFLGFRNQSELPTLFAAADVFVLPSENEPWGLILNEAMCAGLPILTTREVGAAPDLVRHGENGFTFEAGDVPALACHLEALLGDEGLRRSMGERSLEIIEGWSFEQCVQGVLDALAFVRKDARRARRGS